MVQYPGQWRTRRHDVITNNCLKYWSLAILSSGHLPLPKSKKTKVENKKRRYNHSTILSHVSISGLRLPVSSVCEERKRKQLRVSQPEKEQDSY